MSKSSACYTGCWKDSYGGGFRIFTGIRKFGVKMKGHILVFKTAALIVSLFICTDLIAQEKIGYFPHGIDGFTKQSCIIAYSRILDSYQDAKQPFEMCSVFIDRINKNRIKTNKKKIQIIKIFDQNSPADILLNSEGMIMTDYVWETHQKDIETGTQYLAFLLVVDSISREAIGSLFVSVLTMHPYEGCIVLPIYYTDFVLVDMAEK